MRIASPSSSNGMIDRTGPKISSRAMVVPVVDVREDGGLDEPAVVESCRPTATDGDASPLALAGGDVALDALTLCVR